MAKMDRCELGLVRTSSPGPQEASAAALGADAGPRQILVLSVRTRKGRGLTPFAFLIPMEGIRI